MLHHLVSNCIADLKMDAVNFAKASEKFGKFVGNEVVTGGKPNFWKKIYQNYEEWSLIQTKWDN
jgi:hypothetical protein